MAPSVRRLAAKAVLLDEEGCVLLLRGGDPARPDAGTWWFMPGGGLEAGETFEDAVRRELREETGLTVDGLGPIVQQRDVEFEFMDTLVKAHEAYFVVSTPRFEVNTDGWTDLERASMVEHRWWSLDELRSTADTVYPKGLVELIEEHGTQLVPPMNP